MDEKAVVPSNYFNLVQPFQPTTELAPFDIGTYTYSYALFPEEYQPSGRMNMSKLGAVGQKRVGDDPEKTGEKEIRQAIGISALMRMPCFPEDLAWWIMQFDPTPVWHWESRHGASGIELFARNYNIIRISDGTAGLSFIN
jgi:hypothetical protein